MKIFLDVGGHEGQTLSSILDPKYSFDKIFVFEPVKALHNKLKNIAAGKARVTLFEFGLWNKNATQKIFSPGTLGGSLFAAHEAVSGKEFELCEFVDASEWFYKNLTDRDEVYMKLNCEGAEADILLDLLASKEIFKIKNVVIDFDVRKVKGLENAEQDVLNAFKKENFTSFSLVETVMQGPTYIIRTQSWLDKVGANKTDVVTRIRQLGYWLATSFAGKRPGYTWELKHFVKRYTPLNLLKLAGARRS